jgi:hypothetical protein
VLANPLAREAIRGVERLLLDSLLLFRRRSSLISCSFKAASILGERRRGEVAAVEESDLAEKARFERANGFFLLVGVEEGKATEMGEVGMEGKRTSMTILAAETEGAAKMRSSGKEVLSL